MEPNNISVMMATVKSIISFKISASGEINWEKTYGNAGSDWAGEDVDLTADGGLIVGVDDGSLGFLKIAPF